MVDELYLCIITCESNGSSCRGVKFAGNFQPDHDRVVGIFSLQKGVRTVVRLQNLKMKSLKHENLRGEERK